MLHQLKKIIDRWFVAPSSGVHFDLFDGLRGLAIVMVVLAHGLYANPDGSKVFLMVSKMAAMGTLGVPIFFVLSGFLLSLPFFRGREQNPAFWYHPGFANRRLLKIIPPFYLVILALLLINYPLYHDPVYFKLGLAWATGVAHFVWFEKPLNGSFWSLWVEIGFYVVLPFLFLALSGRNIKTTGWVLFALLIAGACLSRFIFWQGPEVEPSQWHFVTSRFPSSLDTFAWGILFAAFYLPRSRDPEHWRHLGRFGYLGMAILVGAALLIFLCEHYAKKGAAPGRWEVEMRHFLPGIGAFFLLFFVFDAGCLAARIFAAPAMRFLGIVSYEWFLIHQPAQHFYRLWTNGSQGSFLRYFCIVGSSAVFSLALAALIYHQFSLPIMKWGRAKMR